MCNNDNKHDNMDVFMILVSFSHNDGGEDCSFGRISKDGSVMDAGEKRLERNMIPEGSMQGTIRFLPYTAKTVNTANTSTSTAPHTLYTDEKGCDLSMYGRGCLLTKIGKITMLSMR